MTMKPAIPSSGDAARFEIPDFGTLPADLSDLARAIDRAFEAGDLLLRAKAHVPHGGWQSWLKEHCPDISARTAQNYMRIARELPAEKRTGAHLTVNDALKLLADAKLDTLTADERQGQLIDFEAERQAREAAEAKAEQEHQARLAAEQRSADWREQALKDRDEKRAAEQKALALEARAAKEPEIVIREVEKIPDDYESVKAKAAQLETELANLKSEQAKLISKQVNSQVNAKLHQYQSEVDEMEKRKDLLQDKVDRMKEYLASLDGEARRIETHQTIIEELRLKLIGLAAFLSDEEPIQDADTVKRWLALAGMHLDAFNAITAMFGEARPRLATAVHEARP